jgi:hypothetical protein
MKRGAAMGKKTIMLFVLATGIAAGAVAGVSHHRAATAGQATMQNLATTTPAATAATDSSKAEPAATTTAAAQAVVVPAGTTLTVRLGEKLGSRISKLGQTFSATLDDDVVVDGKTVIAAGASVNGEVAFVRPGGALVAEPNVQLKLTSVNVKNADLAVATSTRSFGPTARGKKKVGRLMKGLFKRGKAGCQFTSNSELCENLMHKAAGKDKEVLLADRSAYSFTLRQPLQIQ